MMSLRCYAMLSKLQAFTYYPLILIFFLFFSLLARSQTSLIEPPVILDIASQGYDNVLAALKKGDIVLIYNVAELELLHYGIVYFQKFFRRYQQISDPRFSRYYHAFIYIGDGEFAETSSLHLLRKRTLPEFELRYFEEMHVFRYKDSEAATFAADLARDIVESSEIGDFYNYGLASAVETLVSQGLFSFKAKKRYLKAALNAHLLDKHGLFPPRKRGDYKFICTSLVANVYQAAEARDFLEYIKTELTEERIHKDQRTSYLKMLEVPSLDGLSKRQQRIAIDRWASKLATTFSNELENYAEVRFNSKGLNPQMMRDVFKKHADLYKFVIKITNKTRQR